MKHTQKLLSDKGLEFKLFTGHSYKYLPDVIQTLEDEGKEEEL